MKPEWLIITKRARKQENKLETARTLTHSINHFLLSYIQMFDLSMKKHHKKENKSESPRKHTKLALQKRPSYPTFTKSLHPVMDTIETVKLNALIGKEYLILDLSYPRKTEFY